MICSPFVNISLAHCWRKDQRNFEQPTLIRGPSTFGRLQRVFASTRQRQTSHRRFLVLLDKTNDPSIKATQGYPSIGTGDANIHIPQELLPIGVIPPLLLKLTQDRFNLLFA
jgi:hypothetical protein